MSGTPVISTIREGLSGATVYSVRGVLNGTANYVLTRMSDGLDYDQALEEAIRIGYAEPDPSDDVEGHDSVAKARILAEVAFGRHIELDAVASSGISSVTRSDIDDARSQGFSIKHLVTVKSDRNRAHQPPDISCSVQPARLPFSDRLARLEGVENGVTISAEPVGEITIIGPGAGRQQAGQGVFSDLVHVLRST